MISIAVLRLFIQHIRSSIIYWRLSRDSTPCELMKSIALVPYVKLESYYMTLSQATAATDRVTLSHYLLAKTHY
jgi:hypothetical protein